MIEGTSPVSIRSALATGSLALDLHRGLSDCCFDRVLPQSGLGIAASLLFAGLGVLIMLRRYAFPRSLVLDQEGVWIPSGFMRMNVRRVLFAETSAVWEAFLPFRTAVLCLRCHGKTFEVHSTFLPDSESYQGIDRHICSRRGIAGISRMFGANQRAKGTIAELG